MVLMGDPSPGCSVCGGIRSLFFLWFSSSDVFFFVKPWRAVLILIVFHGIQFY